MVTVVEIPLSDLNRIPAVTGLEDVRFEVPELTDIEQAIDDLTPDLPDIRAEVDESIDNALAGLEFPTIDEDQLVADIADAVDIDVDIPDLDPDRLVDDVVDGLEARLDIDFPGTETLVEALVDGILQGLDDAIAFPVEGSLFETEVTLGELLAGALGDVDLEPVDQFPTLAEVREEAETAVETVLDEVLPEWVTLDLEAVADRLAGLIESRLVSEEVRQSLEDTIEEVE